MTDDALQEKRAERNAARALVRERTIARRAICGSCPERKGYFCGKCGCVIAVKTQVAGSSCPISKW